MTTVAPLLKSEWFCGLDLGQVNDSTAFTVVEKRIDMATTDPPVYYCRHIERFLGVPYPSIVAKVTTLMGMGAMDRATLCVDATGVGRPIVDAFRASGKFSNRLVPITITAGSVNGASYDSKGRTWHVPKKELVGTLSMLMQTGGLKVARELSLAKALIKELLSFKVKITAANNETFSAWREKDHDDIVLSLGCALWYAARPKKVFNIW